MSDAIWIPLFLTVLAGLSTSLGSVIALFTHRTNHTVLAISLGFSGGVMIYISFVEMLPAAVAELGTAFGEGKGGWLATAAFFAGMVLIAAIDALVPDAGNPHEGAIVEDMEQKPARSKLMRTGLLTALAIGIHNFPEGAATFFAALHDPAVGLSIAVAIALHNIPEGVSVAVPVFYATGSRAKAFWYSSLSGLSEPVGAVLGYLLLHDWLQEGGVGFVLAGVAGIMVFISLDQLVPNAKRYGKGHESVYGIVGGMGVMAVTLLWLGG